MQRFTSFDGVGIAYRQWSGGVPDAPPVVLVHGFAVDHQLNWVFPGVVNALVGAGHTVVALDARGHGASDKPHDSARYGEETMARDLTALLDLLELTAPRSVHLVGYSMGAIVSLIAATRDPRIARLVIGGVGAGVVEVGGVDSRYLPSAEIIAALSAPELPEDTPPAAREFRQLADAIGADKEALIAQCRVVHATPIPLDRITVPTLVLTGEDDPLAVRPEVLVQAIPGAVGKLVGGDHVGAVADPAFAAAAVDFLSPV